MGGQSLSRDTAVKYFEKQLQNMPTRHYDVRNEQNQVDTSLDHLIQPGWSKSSCCENRCVTNCCSAPSKLPGILSWGTSVLWRWHDPIQFVHTQLVVCGPQSHLWALTLREVSGSPNHAPKAAGIMTNRCFSGRQIFPLVWVIQRQGLKAASYDRGPSYPMQTKKITCKDNR